VDLPREPESEAQVLGALLLQPELFAEVSAILRDEDFYHSRNRIAFELLSDCHAKGTPVDPVSFSQLIPFRSDDPMFVPNLLDAVVTPTSAPYHARRVRDASRLRFLAIAGRDIGEAACAPGAKLEPVLDEAERAVFSASQGVIEGMTWDEALVHTTDRIEHHMQTNSTMDGLETGLHAIDALTGGLQPGWLTYIGARPGVGKTALSLQIATDIAQRGHRVMVCSLEMSVEELARRAICRLASVSYSRVRHNQMTQKDWSSFMHAQTTLSGLPIDVFDAEVDTVPAVASRVRRLKPELVIIDYVQLMRHAKAKNRNEEIGLISRGLKLLARETRIPILAPVQLNRAPEARENKRPNISDLRESGSLEQDADIVMLLSRPTSENGQGTTTTLDLAKFRHGPSGTATLGWDPSITKFYDLY
jgi:replicative DNA helicase